MARFEAKSIGLGVAQDADGDIVPGQPFTLSGPLYAAETGGTLITGGALQYGLDGKMPGWFDPDTDPGVYTFVSGSQTIKLIIGDPGLAARTFALESGHVFVTTLSTSTGAAAANKTIIDNAIAAAVAMGGGIVVIAQTGLFYTNGGHEISTGVYLRGLGLVTRLVNRGSTYTFRLMDESAERPSCGLRDMKVHGALSGVPAISGGIGVELGNGYGFDVDTVWVDGFNDAGVGWKFHNTDGTLDFTGAHRISNIQAVNCTKCIQFIADAAALEFFGEIDISHALIQPTPGQVGIWIGKSHLYNNIIQGHLFYAGNNAIGIEIATADAKIRQGSHFDLRGEIDPAYTGCKRIKMTAAGQFDATGTIFIANALVPDDLSGGGVFNFVEDELSYYEAELLHGRILASAATMTIPGGSSFFEVTGTTSITAILTSWEGRIVTLKFAGILTVTDGGNLRLAGNFVTSADDTITLAHRSGVWYEVCRSAN